jgi:nucleoside-diphosphate-sugar epimerase
MPADPNEAYGWEKLFTEFMAMFYQKDYGLDVRIARFHNVFGPFGTFDGGREKAPAAICRKVAKAKNQDILEIWGDGTQTRSFCYIDDCVRGVIALMKSDDAHGPLNIGTDRLVTINQMADIIIGISGTKITKQYLPNMPVGVMGRNADLTLVKAVLGWEPTVPLEEGLKATYKWIREQVLG